MANIESAKKQARKAIRRTAVNRARITRLKTAVKNVERALGSADKAAAQAAFKAAQPVLMRGIGANLVHKNAVARKLSRLSRRIKAL